MAHSLVIFTLLKKKEVFITKQIDLNIYVSSTDRNDHLQRKRCCRVRFGA